MNWKELTGLIAGIGSVVAVIVAMVWGVPYYVDVKVEQRVKALNDAAGTPPEVTQLQTDVAVMDTKVDGAIAGIEANGAKIDRIIDILLDE